MSPQVVDVMIVGAGPVGLLCAYLGRLLGLRVLIVDRTCGPLQVGRADALNARTLQLLELVDLFDGLYPHGKPCSTSSVWAGGGFVARRSAWWDALEGCFHPHFLMIGQSHVEALVDERLHLLGLGVQRNTSVVDVCHGAEGCTTVLSDGRVIHSRFVIGADGAHSLVRKRLGVPFEITRPRMTWAVIDGVIETDFEKVPEIIVFQAESSDVAWIPREGAIDRFYVRMDTREFTLEQVVARINRAMAPHILRFREVEWFSQFSVNEAVAERFAVDEAIFLAGDACHIHSVNGGQGLNTGLADAFNLMWRIGRVVNGGAGAALLRGYEQERKPVARGVVETSRELVNATRTSAGGRHALDYVDIVAQRAGYVTGMGVRYGGDAVAGTRLHDFRVSDDEAETPWRIYSLLDYTRFTLLVCGQRAQLPPLPAGTQVLHVTVPCRYTGTLVLVRPDAYIAVQSALDDVAPVLAYLAGI